ncbi:hypothetical protein NDU88_008308 [Pleurodeles waltl]|uniref:Uncharacterized protein n=1 Tax=Pleurodeles waltl TaxID=8319 RepID=A0AAV7PU05_PLEWA|nr:hypothetical protein NDU88_008308 [Pleurodeles waltl]
MRGRNDNEGPLNAYRVSRGSISATDSPLHRCASPRLRFLCPGDDRSVPRHRGLGGCARWPAGGEGSAPWGKPCTHCQGGSHRWGCVVSSIRSCCVWRGRVSRGSQVARVICSACRRNTASAWVFPRPPMLAAGHGPTEHVGPGGRGSESRPRGASRFRAFAGRALGPSRYRAPQSAHRPRRAQNTLLFRI